MSAKDIVRYLIGDPRAILRIAKTPSSFWVGLLLVLSAAIARIYDGQDILSEPWHLFVPFGVSLLTATILFLMLQIFFARYRVPTLKWFDRYRGFLSLFWMTAPIAWLYAIPVERFLSARDSAIANVTLLGVVAVWRVLLISRVGSVLHRVDSARVFLVVMLFADILAIALLIDGLASPLAMTIARGMGGIHLSLPESDHILLSVGMVVCQLGLYTAPIWVVLVYRIFSRTALDMKR